MEEKTLKKEIFHRIHQTSVHPIYYKIEKITFKNFWLAGYVNIPILNQNPIQVTEVKKYPIKLFGVCLCHKFLLEFITAKMVFKHIFAVYWQYHKRGIFMSRVTTF